MSLKKWAAALEQSRQEREANRKVYEVNQRRYRLAVELHKLGVPAVTTPDGWPNPALTEEDLDKMLAAERQRQANLYESFVRTGTVTTFPALGVQVLGGDDKVYTIGKHNPVTKTNGSRLLGPLGGAEAKVTEGTPSFSWGKAAVMPLATAPLARKETADAVVIFKDGTMHTVGLDGSQAVRDARKRAVQFNTLAGTFALPAAATANDPAAKLRKLQELLRDGLLSQEEYEAKRSQVINSI